MCESFENMNIEDFAEMREKYVLNASEVRQNNYERIFVNMLSGMFDITDSNGNSLPFSKHELMLNIAYNGICGIYKDGENFVLTHGKYYGVPKPSDEFPPRYIGVRPNFLIWISRQTRIGIGEQAIGVGETVVAGSPRRAVAVGAANLGEQLLTALHIRLIEIAGSRNGKSTVPYHEVDVVLIAHSHVEVARHEIVVYISLYSLVGFALGEILVELSLHFRVF